jgi:membrane-bound lytic murein transglycosylase D
VIRRLAAYLAITAILTGCAGKPPKTVRLPSPASAPAKQTPASAPAKQAPTPAPSRPTTATAAVVPAPISSQLPPPPSPPPADGVSALIAEAHRHFDRGSELYDAGFLKQAKVEFDSAIDVLLSSSRTYPQNDRIRREMNDLVARVHEMEVAALRNGDGFTDQGEQPAAIDDLTNVTTFPAPVNPKQKEAVEADVRTAMHDLPIEINGRVLSALDYFQNGRGRNTMSVGLERIGAYRPMMERILREEGVPVDLVYLAQAESAFLPRATSRAKARGLWQFISSRGKEYGLRQTWWIDERFDPEKATRAAAKHLNDLYEEFNDWYLAMAAYNAGPVRIEQALKKTNTTTFWQLADKRALPRETINYVPTILALAIIGRSPDQYGFTVAPSAPPEVERVGLEEATDLRVIAEALGMPVDLLREMNPHVLRWTTPPDDPEFELVVPKGYSEKFAEKVVAMPDKDRILFRYHVVKKGDTLSVIARKYGVSVPDLTQANKISVKTSLRVGQELLVPMSGARVPPSSNAAVASNAPATPSGASSTPTVPRTTPQATPAVYRVKRGDTLFAIASKFNVTVNDLKKWNKLTSTRLDVGQRLSLVEAKERQAN